MYKEDTMLRATFVHYNTQQDVITLLKALRELAPKRR